LEHRRRAPPAGHRPYLTRQRFRDAVRVACRYLKAHLAHDPARELRYRAIEARAGHLRREKEREGGGGGEGRKELPHEPRGKREREGEPDGDAERRKDPRHEPRAEPDSIEPGDAREPHSCRPCGSSRRIARNCRALVAVIDEPTVSQGVHAARVSRSLWIVGHEHHCDPAVPAETREEAEDLTAAPAVQ